MTEHVAGTIAALELLPCPFCGGDAEIKTWNGGWPDQHLSVQCKDWKCPGKTSSGSDDIAIAAWNTRAPAVSAPDDVARLTAGLSIWIDRAEKAEALADEYYERWNDCGDKLEAANAENARLTEERDEARGKAALNEEWAVESELENTRLRREIARLTERVKVLTEALQGLECACEQLAATRTHEIYLAMIDGGQTDALLALDGRRKATRDALADASKG